MGWEISRGVAQATIMKNCDLIKAVLEVSPHTVPTVNDLAAAFQTMDADHDGMLPQPEFSDRACA
jgi:Ca2+-binding EF-hand superfamily protein